MAPKRPKPPRYQQDAARAAKARAAAKAAQQQAPQRSWRIMADRASATIQAGRAKARGDVAPDQLLHVVRPFGVSREQGLTAADVGRLMALKRATLGYTVWTIQNWDEDRCTLFEGLPGAVAGPRDAERLVEVLGREFPAVRFRIETTETHLSCVVWQPIDEVWGADTETPGDTR